jgi:hypothetical protein
LEKAVSRERYSKPPVVALDARSVNRRRTQNRSNGLAPSSSREYSLLGCQFGSTVGRIRPWRRSLVNHLSRRGPIDGDSAKKHDPSNTFGDGSADDIFRAADINAFIPGTEVSRIFKLVQ